MNSYIVRSVTFLSALLLVALVSAEEKKKPKYVKDMPDTDFTKRDLNKKDYSNYNLENGVFTLCNMKEMVLKGANLRGADFASASLDKADFTECDLREAKFDRAGAQAAIFEKADLRGADMSRCSCQKVNFKGADLRNLKGMQDMTDADFTGADLRGANLQDAKDYTGKAIFKDAKYDKLTRWPRGYDVEASGAVLVKTEPKPEAKKE